MGVLHLAIVGIVTSGQTKVPDSSTHYSCHCDSLGFEMYEGLGTEDVAPWTLPAILIHNFSSPLTPSYDSSVWTLCPFLPSVSHHPSHSAHPLEQLSCLIHGCQTACLPFWQLVLLPARVPLILTLHCLYHAVLCAYYFFVLPAQSTLLQIGHGWPL